MVCAVIEFKANRESLFPHETPKLKLTTAASSCLSQIGSFLPSGSKLPPSPRGSPLVIRPALTLNRSPGTGLQHNACSLKCGQSKWHFQLVHHWFTPWKSLIFDSMDPRLTCPLGQPCSWPAWRSEMSSSTRLSPILHAPSS